MIASKNLEGGSHGLFKYVIHYYATICFRWLGETVTFVSE
jgi:hypothetical protein